MSGPTTVTGLQHLPARPVARPAGRHAGAPRPSEVAPPPDWSFLTGAASPGRAAVGGRRADRIELAGCSEPAVSRLSDRELRPEERFDTIVLDRPDERTVRVAIAALADGGTIRLQEVPFHTRTRLAALLAAAGLDVRTWWERPDAAAPWAIVGLDRPRSAATVLRGVAGRRSRGRAEALLALSGLARRFGRNVTVTATSGGRCPVAAPAVPGTDSPVDALLTPRYRTSRAVIGIATSPDGRWIEHVAKVPRVPADSHLVEREAAALAAFRRAVEDPTGTPGEPVVHHRADRSVLVVAGAPGRPLDRRLARRAPVEALEAGIRWLEAAPVVGVSAPSVDGRADRLVQTALAALHELGGPRHRERIGAAERARRALDRLADRPVPVVFEHGDLSHPNLFRRDDGNLVVIDWERAEPAGFPLHDLTYFTAYLAESVSRPRDVHGTAAAVALASGPGGWARPLLLAHSRRAGIGPVDAALLELLAWTRYLAGLAVAPELVRRPEPHRCEVLWGAALHRAEEALR